MYRNLSKMPSMCNFISLGFIIVVLCCYELQCCPSGCYCLNLISRPGYLVRCWYKQLYYFPSGIPAKTTDLNLSSNKITSLDASTFQGLPNLQGLFLSSNKIRSLGATTFQGLPNLQKLNLRRNEITSFDALTFQRLSNLRILILSSNKITSLDASAFQGLSNLQELDLYKNEITSFDASTFQRLSNLRILNLRKNKISFLNASAFQGLSNLQKLNLGENKITSLDARIFQGLSNLQELDITFNQITSLDAPVLQGLSSLRELNIYSNDISYVDASAFQGLSNLQEMSLSHNSISSLDASTFQGLSNLQKLNLFGNKITSLEATIFQGLSNLKYIYLQRNPLRCSCELYLSLKNVEGTIYSRCDIITQSSRRDKYISCVEARWKTKEVQTSIGYKVKLTCVSTIEPTIADKFNNTISDSSQKYSIISNANEWTLHVKNVNVDDCGKFYCLAGRNSRTSVTELKIAVAILPLKSEYKFSIGEIGVVNAVVQGCPRPDVKWEKKDSSGFYKLLIKRTSGISNGPQYDIGHMTIDPNKGYLTINNVISADAGEYRIIYEGIVQELERKTTVVIGEPV